MTDRVNPSLRLIGLILVVLFGSRCSRADTSQLSSPGQWSQEKARRWYTGQPWPCGFNYVPANAVSYTEMWMDYAFDPKRIDAELMRSGCWI
jgi:hypothetical protein